ncbi:MAG: hypothetical protein ISR48_02240 [Alphaproteobacteria bacterium]|nr:hypothetical protein [Alphaproteobacteria bacterium]
MVTSGSILTASVISSTPPNALGPLTGAVTGTLPPSLAATLSAAAGTPAGASAAGSTQTPVQTPATPAATPESGTQSATATTERGSQISLRLITVDAAPKSDPAVLLQNMAQSRPAGTPLVAGTVTGTNNAGQPYIQTPLGLLLLAEKAPLPRNSLVALEILGTGARPAAAGASTGALLHSPLFSGLRDWPALREAMAALAQIDAAAGQQFINTVLPRPGMEFTTSMLFLLAALRGGELQKWMGLVTINTLEGAGRRDLLNRLGEDFAQLSKLAGEPGSSEWRSYMIPVFDGKLLNMVRLFTKKHRKQDEEEEDQESYTRFLLDIELSKLGQLQFDGLVKPQVFELIIRSHQALPHAMHGDINTIFTNSLEITGYTGLVNFQVTRDFVSIPVDETSVTSAESTLGVTV